MATGYNFVAPYFVQIEFDAKDVKGAFVGSVVPVPRKHIVIGHYRDFELDQKTLSRLAISAPGGTERMYIFKM